MPSTIASASNIGVSGSWAARSTGATANALYVAVLDTTATKVYMYKSGNGVVWTQQSTTNAPTPVSTTAAFSGILHTDGFFYIAYYSATNTINVRRFDTATDTWESANLGTGSAAADALSTGGISIGVRSDGDVLVMYLNTSSFVKYSRREGTTWTSGTSVNAVASRLGGLVVGSSDIAYLSWGDDSANDNSYVTLTSANVLGTIGDFDATAHTTAKFNAASGIVFNDGTNNKVVFTGRDSTGEIDVYHATQSATPSWTTINALSTSVAPQVTSVDLIVFNSKVYGCWATANALLYDSSTSLSNLTFGTDVTLASGLTTADPIPQFIAGLGGLGIVYTDASAIKVEWITSIFEIGASTLSTVATLDSSGVMNRSAQAALSATTSAITNSALGAVGSVAFSALSVLTSDSYNEVLGNGAYSGNTELSITEEIIRNAVINLSATSLLLAAVAGEQIGSSNLSAGTNQVADAYLLIQNDSALDATALLTTSAVLDVVGSAAFSSLSTASTQAVRDFTGQSALNAQTLLLASTAGEKIGTAFLSGTTDSVLIANVLYDVNALFSTTTAFNAQSTAMRDGASAFTTTGILLAPSIVEHTGQSTLTIGTALLVDASRLVLGGSALSTFTNAITFGERSIVADALYEATSNATASAIRILDGGSNFFTTTILDTLAVLDQTSSVNLSTTSVLNGQATAIYQAMANLMGQSNLVLDVHVIEFVPAIFYYAQLWEKGVWFKSRKPAPYGLEQEDDYYFIPFKDFSSLN